jgi:hypothetical protein
MEKKETASLAQPVQQQYWVVEVVGSSPTGGTFFHITFMVIVGFVTPLAVTFQYWQ